MPNPQPQPEPVSLADAPGGDTTFDSLFPAEPTIEAPPTTAAPATPEQQQPTPVATAPQAPAPAPAEEPFITGSKSVYKTREAAVEGLNQKDALIEQLRQRYALTTGIDPITQQPVSATSTAAPQPANYVQNPEKWVNDMAEALRTNNIAAYRDAQAKFVTDLLEPVMPVIQTSIEEQAFKKLEPEIKDVRTFVGSPEYRTAVDANPDLRDAIEYAKSDVRFAPRLPGLYKLAYQSSQGMRLKELLQANQPQAANTQPARTTTPVSTPEPPQQGAAPSLATKEGRKAIIAAFERSNMANAQF